MVSMEEIYEIVSVKTTAVTLQELTIAVVAFMACHCIESEA